MDMIASLRHHARLLVREPGKRLALLVLEQARQLGYRHCYQETTACLGEALARYRGLGFTPCERLGNTGHRDCEITLMLPLG
ncbi:hypothetical protein [Zobellella iuensis]|uniref:N-acetyltransferase domain-containing protein n=1 Tax=Zobellella iuensis TaxID=2803811 RepID=A0ABS1QQC2_9GAMM|nr:hypothetical protein [Zobellella iuensis]MBL1376777.1 hypothetical protein [Zobellella iuensis]